MGVRYAALLMGWLALCQATIWAYYTYGTPRPPGFTSNALAWQHAMRLFDAAGDTWRTNLYLITGVGIAGTVAIAAWYLSRSGKLRIQGHPI